MSVTIEQPDDMQTLPTDKFNGWRRATDDDLAHPVQGNPVVVCELRSNWSEAAITVRGDDYREVGLIAAGIQAGAEARYALEQLIGLCERAGMADTEEVAFAVKVMAMSEGASR